MSTFWLQIYYVVATIFLKYYFLTCTTCSCPFTDGIELQLIQEIWGVPMLLSPVSAKSFMKVTLSYCTTYWWRYNVTDFPLLLICLLSFSSTTVIIKKKSNSHCRDTLKATSLLELWLLKMRYCVKGWNLIDWPTTPSFLPV